MKNPRNGDFFNSLRSESEKAASFRGAVHIISVAVIAGKGLILMVKKYFARANTSAGCINLMKRNLGDIKTIYKLSGESRAVKGRILKEASEKAEEKYSEVECVYSPFDIGVPEGVIIRDTKTAILDEACAENIKESCRIACSTAGEDDEYTKKLKARAEAAYAELYRAYGEAKEIHDEWEKIYISEMNFNKLGGYSEGLIKQLIGNKKGGPGTYNRERFFGASTPDGSVNYIDNITENLASRYFIKGRPGTGKSTFLKRLARAANEAGFDAELYYCSFDKDSLDMVLVPELSFCVFDSTAPHEMFPETSRDSVLDFYEESGLSGTDEKFSREIEDVSEKYRQRIAEGLCYLRLGNLYEKEREAHLLKIADERIVKQISEELFAKL